VDRTRSPVPLLLALVVAACASPGPIRELTPPQASARLPPKTPYLKAHARDGRLAVLSAWQVDESGRSVAGQGQLYAPDRSLIGQGDLRLTLDEVALFETNRAPASPSMAAMTLVTGVSLAVTGYCIANPKACFGSCPTFYVQGQDPQLLQAEGFSESVAPALEARDLDALYRARPGSTTLTLEMANEALETHVVRDVALVVAERPRGGRVLQAPGGVLWRTSAPQPLLACQAPEGDCAPAVGGFDGNERVSETDAEDLARREEIELTLPPGEGPRGLVIAARQTLLSTFLFYDTLAAMGEEAGAWLARLEHGDPRWLLALAALREALGGIEVQAWRDGEWQAVGRVDEAGPLATDVHVVPLPVGSGRLRLRVTRGHWRLDWLAVADLLGPAAPRRLAPASVSRDGLALAALPRPAVTQPGDRYELRFELPLPPERLELFVESRGYYIEWMRDEWLADQDPARLERLMADPHGALRQLAPAFKAREAGMEQAFWSSRYAKP